MTVTYSPITSQPAFPEITDEFVNPTGQFLYYHAYGETIQADVDGQKHVDIRGISPTESWFGATVGPLASYNHWSGLTATYTGAGSQVITSVDDPVSLADMDPTSDVVSIALPGWTPSGFTLTSSYVDFTSNSNGDFTTGPTASVAFNQSTTSLSTSGNKEFRFPLSNLGAIDLSNITGIQFRLTVTGAVTFKVAAIRCLSSSWQYSNIDYNTAFKQIRSTVPLDGGTPETVAFTMPALFRAQRPPSLEDPRPIDSELAIVFDTGSMTASQSFSILMREVPWSQLTQTNLDGMTQDELDDFHSNISVDGTDVDYIVGQRQPELDLAQYRSRTQVELDGYTQNQINISQSDIERIGDDTNTSYIEFNLTWATTGTNVSIEDQDGRGYSTSTSALLPNKTHLLICTLEGNKARAQIYLLSTLDGLSQTTLDTMTQIEIESLNRGVEVLDPALVWDSGDIYDNSAYKRRKGRVGWQANLVDGDAWVDSFRTRSLAFAEILTAPSISHTPVVGSELSVAQSPPIELFSGFGVTPASQIALTRDRTRTTTSESWKVTDYGSDPGKGIVSNSMIFTNFDHTEVEFDIYYPSGGTGLDLYLVSSGGLAIPLVLTHIVRDQWSRYKIPTRFPYAVQTGSYKLMVVQRAAERNTWWIDNVSVHERTMAWYGRSQEEDPWNPYGSVWTPFYDSINKPNGGALFQKTGKAMQIKGVALRQSAYINGPIQTVPKYAELGRITGLTPPDYTIPDYNPL